ncbi:MAG: hypothetical protein R2834_02460 [Rhodothermales bacterium]
MILLAGVVALLVVGAIVVRQHIDAAFVEARINRALAEAGRPGRVSVSAFRLSLLTRSFVARDIAYVADGDSTTPGIDVRIPLLAVQGIRLLPWLIDRRISIRAIALEGLTVDGERASAPDDEAGISMAHLVGRLPDVSVDRITLPALRLGAAPYLGAFDLEIIGLELSEAGLRDTTRVAFCRDLRFAIPSVRWTTADSLHAVTLDGIAGSTRQGRLDVDSMHVTPMFADEAFMRRVAFRTNRIATGIAGVRLAGVDYRALLDQQAIRIDVIAVDSAFLDVYKDKHLPEDPNKPTPMLPHEALQAIGMPVYLDALSLRTAHIQYREMEEDGELQGMVWFDEVNLAGSGISSEPDTTRPDGGAALLYARARFQDAGILHAAFEMPLHVPTFMMRYHGTLSGMSAELVSPVLTNLKGIRIGSGYVDSLAFDIRVDDARADGEVRVAYRDLKMGFVDKVDRSRRLQDRLKTFFVNGVLIAESNPASPDEPLRVGETAYVRDEDPFFRFLWRALRDGLKASVNR